MKCLSLILIISLLCYSIVGCSRRIIKYKNEIRNVLISGNTNYVLSGIQKKDDLLPDDNIYVQRTDSSTYYFCSGMYKFQYDTLYGEGFSIHKDKKQESRKIKIGLKEIEFIEIESQRMVDETTILVIGVIAITTILVVIIIEGMSDLTMFSN